MASFLECFPLEHIAELKSNHLYSGLPKQFKAMVAYLKASSNERMYSNYLWAAQEAKKGGSDGTILQSPTASTSKPLAMSFFPLWKLKCNQPATTPCEWVVHLEEESADKEEYINSKDQDGIEGITEEFIVHLARAVKDAQQVEKHCYHCRSPDHFIHNCLLVSESKADSPLNQREGMVPKKGAWAPQGKPTTLKVTQDRTPKA